MPVLDPTDNPRGNPPRFTNVVGVESDPQRFGVIGSNLVGGALGFLGGSDLVFHQHAGVYGESDGRGVFGNSSGASVSLVLAPQALASMV